MNPQAKYLWKNVNRTAIKWIVFDFDSLIQSSSSSLLDYTIGCFLKRCLGVKNMLAHNLFCLNLYAYNC